MRMMRRRRKSDASRSLGRPARASPYVLLAAGGIGVGEPLLDLAVDVLA
jgi:hypothetical protein